MDEFKFIENIKGIELKEKIACSKENSRLLNVDFTTFKQYDSWFLYENNYYYFKQKGIQTLFNHLVGERVAHFYKLPVSHFEFARYQGKEGLASLNFRKPEVNYCYGDRDIFPFHSIFANLSFLENFFLEDKEYQLFLKKFFDFISFHIYIGVNDLFSYNLLFEKEEDKLKIAPIYDFDYSFNAFDLMPFFSYSSGFGEFILPCALDGCCRLKGVLNELKTFESLLELYPDFKHSLLKILTIPMERVIEDVEAFLHITFPDCLFEHYIEQDRIKKDLIRNLNLK